MANLLVTGGAGFIGANFVHYWAANHHDDLLIVLDCLTYAGNLDSLAGLADCSRVIFVHGDIRDRELVIELLEKHEIETIIHFAAESHVDRSISGPAAFVDTNIVGTLSILEAARSVWLSTGNVSNLKHRFHHISTDEVFGSLDQSDPAFHEATAYAPNSPYAASKASSDHLVRAYHHTYGLQTTISNCSNNYGPYQFPEKLIPLMVLNALRGQSLPVYGDGSNIRDWLFVEDHVRAVELILQSGCPGETYNVGGRAERKNIEIVEAICSSVDNRFAHDPQLNLQFPMAPPASGTSCNSLVTYVTDRPGHDWRYAVDTAKIERHLGFLPEVTLSQGLERTVGWIIENESWWRSILDGSYRKRRSLR